MLLIESAGKYISGYRFPLYGDLADFEKNWTLVSTFFEIETDVKFKSYGLPYSGEYVATAP